MTITESTDSTWFADVEPTVSGSGAGGTTYLEAIRLALDDILAADPSTVLLGEDIGVMGGAFRATKGLFEKYGPDRVIDTPLAEAGLIGASIGMAIQGMKPIVELQFADFISCAYDQLVTQAAKLHYRFGISVPLVVRAPSGGGVGAGPFHSQSPEGVFAHIPGLKVVCPGGVQDSYDLLWAAVKDPNPVLYFEHKALYRGLRGDLIRAEPSEGLGVAKLVRRGRDITVVTYGGMVPRTLAASDRLAAEDIEVEVIDLRTISPLDTAATLASVAKTSRLAVIHEDTRTSGVGAEVMARVIEGAFFDLDAPIWRITAPDTPVPLARELESVFIPSEDRIVNELRSCLLM